LDIFQEYKVNKTPTKSAVNKLLRIAAKQADHIILWIESDISLNDLERGIKGRIKLTKNVKEVWIILDSKIRIFTRDHILGKDFTISK
jgi:hypothetical protein